MADYSKLKVNELKEELKARGIPFVGLKLKQNFIDKLLEADAVGQTNASGALVTPVGGAENREADEKDSSMNAQDVQSRDEPAQDTDTTAPQPTTEDNIAKNKSLVYPDSGMDEKEVRPEEARAKLQSAADNVPEDGNKEPISRDGTITTPAPEVPKPAAPEAERKQGSALPAAGDGPGSQSPLVETLETLPHSSAASTPHVPIQEMIEDSRKRKRRSVTQPPSASDVAQKRAKAIDGSPRITRSGDTMEDEQGVTPDLAVEGGIKEVMSEPSALERMREATDTAGIMREADGVLEGAQSASVHATLTVSPEGNRAEEPMIEPPQKPPQSPEKRSVQNGPGTSLFAGLKNKD